MADEQKRIDKNKRNSDIAKELTDGHSLDTLYKILDEYFEIMINKSIAGKVRITNIESLKNDKELYDLIIINCSGKLIYETFSNLLDFKIQDGKKIYLADNIAIRTARRNKKTFVKRMNRKDILDKLLKYGVKCDLHISNECIV